MNTYRVQLRSGGAVTVTADLNLFALPSSDRTFVLGIVDLLKTYEENASSSTDTPTKAVTTNE